MEAPKRKSIKVVFLDGEAVSFSGTGVSTSDGLFELYDGGQVVATIPAGNVKYVKYSLLEAQ